MRKDVVLVQRLRAATFMLKILSLFSRIVSAENTGTMMNEFSPT